MSVVEYGRDWNFFFTLFIVLFAGFIITSAAKSWVHLALIGFGVLCYYQLLLWFGLSG